MPYTMTEVFIPVMGPVIVPVFGSPWGGSFLPPDFSDDILNPSTLLAYWDGTNASPTTKADKVKPPGDFQMEMSDSHALLFDGVSDYGSIPSAPWNDGADGIMKIEFECKLSSTSPDYGQIIVKREGTSAIYINGGPSNGKNYVRVDTDAGINQNTAFQELFDDQYHKVSILIDNGNITVDVDGVITTDTYLHGSGFTNTNDLFVGYDGIVNYDSVGLLWNLKINDVHFPLAEGSGATCYSTDGQHQIALTSADISLMRSGLTNTYHRNVISGWYEITADPVKYPYPVAGYTTYHRPNSWNNAETLQKVQESSVGTFDGVTDKLVFTTDHGTLDSFNGSATPTYTHPDLTSTAGILRDLVFSDGTTVPLNEGSGTDIHDSNGDVVATLTSADVPTFWATKQAPAKIIAADAAYNFLTDASGNSTKNKQSHLEGNIQLDVASVSFTTPDPIDYLKLNTADGSDWYMDGVWYPSDVYQSHAAGSDIKIGVPEGVSITNAYLWNNGAACDLAFGISQTGWTLTGTAYFYNTAVTGDISQTGWALTVTASFYNTAVTGDISQTGWLLTGNASFSDTAVSGDISQTGWALTGSASFNNCPNLTTASSATTLFGAECLNIRIDGCALTVASVDNVLQAVDALGGLSGTLALQGGTNGVPTSVGLTAKTNLEGKGWTVTVNV